MSLSDYSSDDSLEAEDTQIKQKVRGGFQKAKMSGKGAKTSDAGSSPMILGALAALAVAGVAAGSLYMRQHLTGRKPESTGAAKQVDEGQRKDLRRKRGEVKESPQTQPFMTRTESSVGPLRKQPRRDTSEESGGEASGSSPTAGAHANKPKVLRKTVSKNRHKRPPVRAPAFEMQKEASEDERTVPADDAKAPEGQAQMKTEGKGKEGSRTVPMPAGDETAGSGTQKEAAEEKPVAHDRAESSQGDSKLQAEDGGAISAAKTSDMEDQPAHSKPSSADKGSSAAEASGSPTAAEDVGEASSKENAIWNASKKSLPDLFGKPLTASTATQPSLDTFTADCDVLDTAIEATETEKPSPAKKEAVEAPKAASSKNAGSATDEKTEDSQEHYAQEVQALKGSASSAAAEPVDAKKVNEKLADSTENVDGAGQQATEAKTKEAAGTPAAKAGEESEPKEDPAAREPLEESKPDSGASAAATGEATGKKSDEEEISESKVTGGAAKLDEGAAEAKDSVSKPESGEVIGQKSAEKATPKSTVTEGGAKPDEGAVEAKESVSKPESGDSKGEDSGKKQAPMSDEQKVVLERGDSLMAEADKQDPKGIQLIRHMQAEVDKQDDMLDFSKTDAYRSTKTKEAEGRTKASTDQKEPSQDDAGKSESERAGEMEVANELKGDAQSSEEPVQEQPAMKTEPSLELMADTTPDGEQLDLSSAEVDTVTSIAERPEKAKAEDEDAKKGKPASEKKPEAEETPKIDAPPSQTDTREVGQGAEIETQDQKEHQKDVPSKEEIQADVKTPSEQELHEREAAGKSAKHLEATPASESEHAKEQSESKAVTAETTPVSESEHAKEQSKSEAATAETTPASEEQHAKEQPESEAVTAETAPASKEQHAKEQPKSEAVTAETIPASKEQPESEAVTVEIITASKEQTKSKAVTVEIIPASKEQRAKEQPKSEAVTAEIIPASGSEHAKKQPKSKAATAETTPASEEQHAKEKPKSEAVTAETTPASKEPHAKEQPQSEAVHAQATPASKEPHAEEQPKSEAVTAETTPASKEPHAKEQPQSEEVNAQTTPASKEPHAEEQPKGEAVTAETTPASKEQPESEAVTVEILPASKEQPKSKAVTAEIIFASGSEHAKEQPKSEAMTAETTPASKEPHAEEQPKSEAVTAETTPASKDSHTKEQPKSEAVTAETTPASKEPHAKEQPQSEAVTAETTPASKEPHAKEEPQSEAVTAETTPASKEPHAEEQPKSEAVTAETRPASKEPHAKEQPRSEAVTRETTPASDQRQAPTKDVLENIKNEQCSTASKSDEAKPNGTAKGFATDAHHADIAGAPEKATQPPTRSSEPANASEEASQHSASAAAGIATALATEDRNALISSQPSIGTVQDSTPAGTESRSDSKAAPDTLTDAVDPDSAAAKAPYDPLGMDVSDEAAMSPELAPEEEVGTEASVDEDLPRNNTERDVQLNLAVALRMIEERGNIAAAERTLQKQLAAVKDSKDTIRPEFMQRLAGTLADVIARARQQEAVTGKHSPSQPDRMPEIISLLQTAFESSKATGDLSRSREGWRLGNALMQTGKLDEAEALFKEEIKHSEDHLGADNANTQQTRAYLAEVLAKTGNKTEAYRLLSDASKQLEQHGKNLASTKGGESKPDGAADGEEAYSGVTPQAAAIMSAAKCSVKLAGMQDEDKEYKDAEASARRAVSLMDEAFGKGNPRNATAYGTLASILKHIGEEKGLQEAIDIYKQLQQIIEDIHGIRNDQSAFALRSIADVHLMLKENGEAVECLEKARQIAASVNGKDHPMMESFWDALAEAKKAAGDNRGAKEASRQALLVKSHGHRPGGGGRSPRDASAARRGKGRSRR